MTQVLMLGAKDVRELLSPAECIEAVAEVMAEVSRGAAHLPLRSLMRLPNGLGALGVMPGAIAQPERFGMKLISLFPGNAGTGRSSHMGLYVLYESRHGEPLAILEAGSITAIRTAAASAVATRALARRDARVLGILGTGEEAESHIAAFAALRRFDEVWIWGRSPRKADSLIQHLGQSGYSGLRRAASIDEVCAKADVICTVTAASEPVLFGRQLRPGTHLCLVGSSTADYREVDDECVTRGRFFVDFRGSALAQAGELLHAMSAGLVTEAHISAEIGEVLAGTHPGRTSEDEITIYKSLGIAAQDLAAASLVHRKALAEGRGTKISFD